MFFIKYKDNIFNNKDRLPTDKLNYNSGPLKFVSTSSNPSFLDNDLQTRRSYILNAFRKSCKKKSVRSNYSSGSSSTSLRSKLSNQKLNKFYYSKRILKSAEDLRKTFGCSRDELLSELSEAKEKINELISEKELSEKRINETKEEVSNLRQLLKDVEEELVLMNRLKNENINLRSQLNTDVNNKLKEAEDEINALSSQLEIYKKFQTECADIKQSYNKLKEDYDALNLRCLEFKESNESLKNDLESYKRTESTNLCRELYASNAIVDREALRARINCKDEKIRFLVSFLEEQEMTIHDLASQLDRLTRAVAEKDCIIGKQMENLKLTLSERTARIITLEDQLHSSELLIRELENVREHFRLANASLNQNMIGYKTQFKSVVSCSERLLMVKEKYEKELEEKDATIKKMSKFAQSPKSIVYLSQILHVLNRSEDSISDDTDSIFSFVPSVRKIVEKMKSELWRDTPLPDLEDSEVQAVTTCADDFTQNDYFFYSKHKSVEADLPDKLYFEHENLKNKLSETLGNMSLLEEAYYKKDEMNKELERKLINAFDEATCKEKEIAVTQRELELVQEKLLTLKGELEYSDSLLNRALAEIETGQDFLDSTSDLLSVSLDRSLVEYTRYVDMMETFVIRKEEQVESIQNYVKEEICQKAQFENDYIFKLESEVKRLAENYTKKKQTIHNLTEEIESLESEVKKKCSVFKMIQENLLRTLNSLDEATVGGDEELYDFMKKIFKNFSDLDPDEILIEVSEKILVHSENLGRLYKKEHRENEILRKETYPKSYVRQLTKKNQNRNKKLRKKVKTLRTNVNKIKQILLNTRKGITRADKEITTYKENINSLGVNCKKYQDEENFLRGELNDRMNEIENMKCVILKKDVEFSTLISEKDKMEKVLLKIINSLETSLTGIGRESIGTITEDDALVGSEISDLTSRNNELSNVIFELQERLDNLLYVPQREKNCSNSVCVQVNVEEESRKLKEMENEYNDIVCNLKGKHAKEIKGLEMRNVNNLDTFKNIYVKDLNSICNSYQENISKLQEDFTEHICRLKLLHGEDLKNLVNKYEIQKLHEEELENQKLYYENLLAGKDCEMNNEIKELRIEIQNIITKKEEVINKIKESAMLYYNKLSDLKKRFKKQMNKLRVKCEKKTKENEKMNELISNMNVQKLEAHCQTEVELEPREELLNISEMLDRTCQTSGDSCVKESGVQCVQNCGRGVSTQTDCHGRDREDNTEASTQEIPAKGKRNHVVFGLPPNKNIDINYKESIKCSIQEAKATAIGDFLYDIPQSYGSSAAVSIRDIAVLKDKNELVNRIEELENELIHKTEGFNRNVSMYQETIRRHMSKIADLENALNQECLLTCRLQHRLGLEFNNAEQLRAERNSLQKRVDQLEVTVHDREQESQTEREKYQHLKKHFDDIMCQRKASDQLEVSLKRLKEKLETAVEYEKKLTKEIQEDRRTEERIKDIIVASNSERELKAEEDASKEPSTPDDLQEPVTNQESQDLKVVFIQQCEFRRTWSRQVYEKNP